MGGKLTFRNIVTLVLLVVSLPAGYAEAFTIDDENVRTGQRPKPVQISIVRTLSQGEPELLVTAEGAFQSHIQAPDGRRYSQLSIPGCGVTAKDIGYPAMPFKGFFLEVPYGVDVSAELVGWSVSSLGSGFLIYPKQPPIPLPDCATCEPAFEINKAVYATDAFFPPSTVVIDEPGFIRGRRVVFVQVFPLQYNPVTTELLAFSSLRFRLQFKGTADKSGEARKRRLATKQSEAFAKDLILNYEPVKESGGQGGLRGLSTGDAADYLIIVADELYEEILPLAEWKHKKGFITRVADMNEVGSTASDVNDYIYQAYHTWDPAPSYVLLVGDHDDVPPNIIEGHPAHDECDPWPGPHKWPSDQPYTYVDHNDYYPDLTIGRLSVHTESECNDVVDKILTYDRDPDTGDWYVDLLAAAYFQDDNNDSAADLYFMETAMTVYDFLVNDLSDFTGHTALCTTHWPLDHNDYHFKSYSYYHRADLNLIRWGESPYPDPVPAWIVNLWTSKTQATSDITTAINGGAGIVQHSDHGGKFKWVNPNFTVDHVNALTNGEKTPVVFSTNCLTGAFDGYCEEKHNGHTFCFSTGDNNDCLAEAFQKHSDGGAVGVVAATRVSYCSYNDLIAHGTYTCFWPSYDPNHTDSNYAHSWRPAEALTYGKYYMRIYMGTGSYTELEFNVFHWFGDPEMMLRTETPEALSVSHISIVEPDTAMDVTVTVTSDSNAVEGALVAITHPSIEQDYWTGFTDANGSVTFSNITFSKDDSNDPNDYDIVVSAHNCIPYEGTIFVYEDVGFCVKNNSDEIVAWFDNLGNLFLKGTLTQQMTPTASANDEFRFQDSNSSDLAIIDTNSGNMYIDGTVYQNQSSPSPSEESDDFIIKDSNGEVVAYIDDSGDVYLKGELYDYSNP